MQKPKSISILPIPLRGEVHPGDALGFKILEALKAQKLNVKSGDILFVKHKIVSKA